MPWITRNSLEEHDRALLAKHGYSMEKLLKKAPYFQKRTIRKQRWPRALVKHTGIRKVYPKRISASRLATGQQELKFFDGTRNDADILTTGIIKPSLNLIVQGTGESQRIGRKVVIRKIDLRITAELKDVFQQNDIPKGDILRVILFVDKQANGANAVVTDILETAEINSYRNLSQVNRFKILYNGYFTLNRLGTSKDDDFKSASPVYLLPTTKVHRDVNIEVEFSGTAGTISEVTSSNVGILFITEGNRAEVRVKFRIRYFG